MWKEVRNNEELARKAAEKPIEISLVEIKKDDSAKTRQVVESSLVQKSETPDKDAFLGQQTQTVIKQTRAANTGHFEDGHAGGGKGAVAKQQVPKTSPTNELAKPNGLSLQRLGLKHDLSPLGHLAPGALAASSDYLKDTELGAQTLLNTREFVYYSYYQRVRHQLEQFWEPGLRERLKKMFDRGRTLVENREHSTHLVVYMNKEGSITRIEVEDTSGLIDLDQAAIDAFNKAGPFPNPPTGMIEYNGIVKIDWTFVLRT